ncbi:uncharacterized protein VTP21DRAFT_2240 [Calcarisporiella thermophila]|uniref:uncharacterized protein n=1 Tax=Calcarisporiella thermophila TaxID=911321 RepID=UPI003741EEC4
MKHHSVLQKLVIALGLLLLVNLLYYCKWVRWFDCFRRDPACRLRYCGASSSLSPPRSLHSSFPSILESSDARPPSSPLTIVTAASVGHFCELEAFLYNLSDILDQMPASQQPRVVVYDLGLHPLQFNILRSMRNHGMVSELVRFEFAKYPKFWSLSETPRGEYAWKAGIVHEVLEKARGTKVVWVDAGDKLSLEFLRWLPEHLTEHGFWSPRSSGTMQQWVHPGTLAYFGDSPHVYADYPNCNGAAVGFDTSNHTVVEDIIKPWLACSLVKECLAPKGSSRANHRQDQAVLTLLAVKAGFQCLGSPKKYGVQTHQDKFCIDHLKALKEQRKLLGTSTLSLPKWTRLEEQMRMKQRRTRQSL